MRRGLVVVLAVLATIGMVAPPASAQAPAPVVTINGFLQQVTTWTSNLSLHDQNVTNKSDRGWYTRTRLRMDPTAQVGNVKAVWRFEFDHSWGQTGAADNVGPNRSGTTGSFDLNTDVVGTIENTWFYTEFPVTGPGSLMPFIPIPTVGRFGAQPFGTAATYKLAAYATGDFAGVNLVTTLTPNVRVNTTYVQVEESVTGAVDGFIRGDDFAVIFAPEITPFKGLDIKPMYAYFFADGSTSGSARANRGGLPAAAFVRGAHENRHTIGVDARWRSGPFSLDPTVMYQFGHRETVLPAAIPFVGSAGAQEADISAWLIDVRAGVRAGPLLIEPGVMWTSGNKAGDNLTRKVRSYERLDTDTTYWAGWANIFALDVDFNQMVNAGANFGNNIGYDRYGRFQVGARVFYDVTPNFTPWFKGVAVWTSEKVDTSSTFTNGSLQPSDGSGDRRYLGTEIDFGFTWRFAPSIFLEAVYAHLFSGKALSFANRDPKDVDFIAARVNYSW